MMTYKRIKEKMERSGKPNIAGTVVLMKKNLQKEFDLKAPVLDRFSELCGHGVSFQLISSTHIDTSTGRGRLGKPAYIEKWITTMSSLKSGESKLGIKFEWDENDGIPGAVIVKNNHPSEFFLKNLVLDGVLGVGKIHFECNSWVYPANMYKYDRVFFVNHTYLPSQTPEPLRSYRDIELYHLRGDHVSNPLKEEDRVYGYAVYNDLGDPDNGSLFQRPILGGSYEKPYPRRGRTSRPPAKKDSKSESRIFSKDIYVPRDERFGHLKTSDFLAYKIKSSGQSLFSAINSIFNRSPGEFQSFEETFKLYMGGLKIPNCKILEDLREMIPQQVLKELVRKDDCHVLRFPLPDLIKDDKFAWRADEEFARQMLAGVNPLVIRRLVEFPPSSKLDKTIYGDQTSTIKPEHIEMNMDGYRVEKALRENRLFILDHHDTFMPYLKEINELKGKFIYATRTFLFLKNDGTLKPLAIELSLPNPYGMVKGPVSQVFTPCLHGVEGSMWQLAKAYAAVNDASHHQLISHWLNTHAVMEPFVIATNRQLSVMHPIHKLLSPHFKDTMNINALARQELINAEGIIESTFFPGKYALGISSDVYKGWNLTDQSLPHDLLNRGMAVEDDSSPHKLRLLVEDYPYAVDGLEIWSAIDSWVNEYCSIYYPDDNTIKTDSELQAWWKEIREVGHGDLKDETWWPIMDNVNDLTKTCTTMIWIASALHAAVNFGQYSYAGYYPSRPTISRCPMPEPGKKEYEELKENPEKVFLRTFTSKLHSIIGVSIVAILSRHSSDEVYLGQCDSQEWTYDKEAIGAFNRFSERLLAIELRIKERNIDPCLKNRKGPSNMPYMLLFPNTSDNSGKGTGTVGMGIPNSVSI